MPGRAPRGPPAGLLLPRSGRSQRIWGGLSSQRLSGRERGLSLSGWGMHVETADWGQARGVPEGKNLSKQHLGN